MGENRKGTMERVNGVKRKKKKGNENRKDDKKKDKKKREQKIKIQIF